MLKPIFLIGMPGSGKSTLGKKLAKKMNCFFIDLDIEIEKENGSPITEIFEIKGEEFFRELETKKLIELINLHPNDVVISVGGGTPCFHNNINVILQHGMAIYLKTDAITLSKRIEQGNDSRPMFKGLTTEERINKISALLKNREVYYLKANLIYDVIHGDVDELLTRISELKN